MPYLNVCLKCTTRSVSKYTRGRGAENLHHFEIRICIRHARGPRTEAARAFSRFVQYKIVVAHVNTHTRACTHVHCTFTHTHTHTCTRTDTKLQKHDHETQFILLSPNKDADDNSEFETRNTWILARDGVDLSDELKKNQCLFHQFFQMLKIETLEEEPGF